MIVQAWMEAVVEDQYAGEHYFLPQLRSHRWRVNDPADALLFVVPIYANAALMPSREGTSCNGTHFQALLDRTGRASYLVFFLAAILLASGVLMAGAGIPQILRTGFTGFRPICGRTGAAARKGD